MTFTLSIPDSDPVGKVSMSYPCEEQPDCGFAQVRSLDKVSSNLASPRSSDMFQTTLRWLIYKIVEANKAITLVQLKKTLRHEYGIDRSVIDPAVSSLTSSSLLNGIKKWRNPRMREAGDDVGIHLFIHAEQNATFSQWCDLATSKYPELVDFVAPTINAQPRGKVANA